MRTNTESLTRWPHTGIDAPIAFTITGFHELETDCGVAYSATPAILARWLTDPRAGTSSCTSSR